MEERIGIIGKMHGVRLSNSPNPKKAAALAPSPSVASPRAMRSVSESSASAGRDPAGKPGRETEELPAGADDPPGGRTGGGSVEPHLDRLPDRRVTEPRVGAALVDHVQGEGRGGRASVGKPHRRHRLETVDLDPAEVGILLGLAGWEVEPGNRSPRGGTLREMHLHPLGVEVVAGLDAPPDDGEARVPRRRLQPERGVRMQELRLLAPGVDEVLEEAGRRIGVPFRTLRA